MKNEVIRLVNITKTYNLGLTKLTALRKVNLTLFRGEFTAVVGASGSGKSTLLNMIGCIDEPDEGQIFLEDRETRLLSDAEKSRMRNLHIGFIFQSFNLIPVLSVYENIELPLIIQKNIGKNERNEFVEQAILDVGLKDFRNQKPDQLSGGQRQRVAIARALVSRPSLVLADEPTANLDSVNSQKIIDLMLEINEKKQVTFLFSTHDEKLMQRMARIVHIKDGEIIN